MEGALIEQIGNAATLSDHELVAHLAGIIDASDDAIISSNLDGQLVSWNEGATRLYGWAAAEALVSQPTQLIPAEICDFEDRILQRVLAGELVGHYDSQRLRKDGSLVEVDINVSATRDSAGRISGIAQVARDLSHRRKTEQSARAAEERLSEARKLEGAGALAGSVAHDINNLLAIVLTYSSLVLEALEPDNPLRPDLVEICQAAGRAVELTRELRKLASAADTSRASETILVVGPAALGLPDGDTKNCA